MEASEARCWCSLYNKLAREESVRASARTGYQANILAVDVPLGFHRDKTLYGPEHIGHVQDP